MGVIIELTVPSEEFVLGRLLRLEPGIRINLEQIVPLGGKKMPFCWVSGDFTSFEDNMNDRIGYSVVVTDDVNGRKLYRLEWDEEDEMMDAIIDSDGTVLEAEGTYENWEFRIRFNRREDISRFHEYCGENGVPIKVGRIYTPLEVTGDSDSRLTATQMQTLIDAFEEGYFDIPRKISLEELSNKYGVSDQAVSERLRRATSRLIESSLLVEDKPMAVSRGDD
ncbi:MAG: helix-turn-helix domain-containing protein [Halobacteriales archaeon]|nr:helix-turn-helix domain-containing protein [Halobacteriales archaeon]